MNPQNTPADSGGASANADDTGTPNPANNPAPSQPTEIEKAVAKALAPVTDALAKLTNSQNANRRRQSTAARTAPPDDDNQNDSDSDVDLDDEAIAKLDKNALVDTVKTMNRRLRTIESRDRSRQEADLAREKTTTIKNLITDGKYANAEVLEMAIAPYVKRGTDGQWLYDDGKTAVPLADKVKQMGSTPTFRPSNPGDGVNAEPTFTVRSANGQQTTVSAENLAKMPRAERKKALRAIANARPQSRPS